MFYMLDTDISSYIIRENPLAVIQKFDEMQQERHADISISAIVYSELMYGGLQKPSMMPRIQYFLQKMEIKSWPVEAGQHYADIRRAMKSKGCVIGAHDMQIAAHARSLGAVIVTNNTKHYEPVPGILVENWAEGSVG